MTTTRRASRCARGTTRRQGRAGQRLVNDAQAIIAALDGEELDGEQADAVGLLALVAGQDVEPGDNEGTWRIADGSRRIG